MRSREVILTAAIVLAAGLGLAMLFWQPPAADDTSRTAADVQHRVEGEPGVLMEMRTAPPVAPATSAETPVRAREPARLNSMPLFEEGSAAVPHIAQRYPAGETPPPPPAEVRHRIIDGDTLASLAQRYLGDAGRARNLFEANRDVLNDPELLPIGAVLRIPPR